MCSIGLSCPPGLTVTTDVCARFHKSGKELPPGVFDEVLEGLTVIEDEMDRRLGDPSAPLLLSVRSGAAVSMPGMMDTVLNLGMNDAVAAGLAEQSGNPRFAYDSYRRFLDMFGDVVMGVPHGLFEAELEGIKAKRGVTEDTELTADDLKELVEAYKGVYAARGTAFPEDPLEQLRLSIFAVFDSWESDRANKYRAINKISGLEGTAVNVQAMVFGNMGESSGTGVCFTRDPSTGEAHLYGEYLVDAQGEDVVAGIRTPEPIETMAKALPQAYEELLNNTSLLERHYKDMQDIEFTVQDGRLYMLQCRSGKRTGAGAVKIAADMVKEGLRSTEEALKIVEPGHIDQLLHPQFKDEAAYKSNVMGKGLPASPGAAVGRVVFSAADAEAMKARGEPCVLVTIDTSPEDVGGMHAAEGVVTARGGMTSHAAVVARGWGKPCVCGCDGLRVDSEAREVEFGGVTLLEGDWISLNGATGEVISGRQELSAAEPSPELLQVMSWADEARNLNVLANADTPADAAAARANGAEGIGLCRTEHMFFESDARLLSVRKMILAEAKEQRQVALDELLPFQRGDFEGIFRAMQGLPVAVRLMDPPLHEFLPDGELEEVCEGLAADTGVDVNAVLTRVESLEETNPMLGFRGCRLGVAYPELPAMQARAVFEAACAADAAGECPSSIDVMVPLVGTVAELAHHIQIIRDAADAAFVAHGKPVAYRVGTMVEIPRACLIADELAAAGAEFFSFGTNDLTQMTFGYSRDDASRFIPTYLEEGVLAADPFEALDQEGVGQLIQMATERGRSARADIKVGVCGEQGGEPSSVAFCDRLGLDYVSCSPFRVPIARLAAAHAALAARDA